jgi:hypothetical protein
MTTRRATVTPRGLAEERIPETDHRSVEKRILDEIGPSL